MTDDLGDLGRSRRLARILGGDAGRGLVVAIDHGLFMGPVSGARVLHETVRRVVAAGPDGIQLTAGALARCAPSLRDGDVAIVYRLDATNVWRPEPMSPSPGYWAPVGTPLEAVRAGAAAAVAFLLGGWPDDDMERQNLRQLATWSRECRELGLPFIIEPLPVSGKVATTLDERLVRLIARMAADLGCDALKLDFGGDAEAFAELVADVQVPVLVRGGPKAASRDQYLEAVRAALAAGARGLVVGRNVFDNDDPGAAVAELMAVLRDRS